MDSRRRTIAIAVSVAAALVAAVGIVAFANLFAKDPNENCAGVPRDMGGCDPGQPSFSATTCAGVGTEFGAHVHRRGLAIIDGPTTADGQSRASRMIEMEALVTARANQYLRDTGMIKQCGVDEFIAAAETQFSPAFKERVGDYLYDGTTRPYSEWVADLRRTAGVIDMGEDEPFLPVPTP